MSGIQDLLRIAIKEKASDLYLKVGVPPILRINDELYDVELPVLTKEDTERLAKEMMKPAHLQKWERWNEVDFAYEIEEEGRFRVNVYTQRETVAIVVRQLSIDIPSFEELGLPAATKALADKRRGLVLITGVAGSGKTTTLAAMINHINHSRRGHIITIEDPIEIMFDDGLSLISQREIGSDTTSYERALKMVLRETPDVILIGEMRDRETVEAAMSAAETGHLVLSTLHTINASETINRIMDFFPSTQHKQVRQMLASSLEGIISQRLVQKVDGTGRTPAVEILLNTPTVREYLLDEEKVPYVPTLIAKGEFSGMQTMDQSLKGLVDSGIISEEEAMRHAASAHDLGLSLKGEFTQEDSGVWAAYDS